MTAQTPLTLEEVAEAFKKWRSDKVEGEQIPKHLWSKVRELLSQQICTQTQLILTLRITHRQLKREGLLELTAAVPQARKVRRDFVEIDTQNLPLPLTSVPPPTLSIQRGEVTLCLQHPSQEQIQQVITAFIR